MTTNDCRQAVEFLLAHWPVKTSVPVLSARWRQDGAIAYLTFGGGALELTIRFEVLSEGDGRWWLRGRASAYNGVGSPVTMGLWERIERYGMAIGDEQLLPFLDDIVQDCTKLANG